MLVLSRKVGQKIRIGPQVVIEVLHLPGGRVKLGIEAPGLKIVRDELPPEDPADVPHPVPQAA